MLMEDHIRLLYIDLFCGAGGTSSGVEYARLDGKKCAKVIACVNHDPHAIMSHAANHPDVLHFTEDIRSLELSPLMDHLAEMKRKYPEAEVAIWASLECTNFSKAKGGQPRDADSRTLAEHLYRYIETIDPDYLLIENVEEFMCWGKLDANGKPVSRDKGTSYLRWVRNIKRYGYDFEWRILNAADYGAYTARKRFFGVFAKHGLPIAFPIPTYAKDGDDGMFKVYKKWKPVKEVLDLEDEGTSIFGKSKPLCERTLERIYAGLVKFVAGGKRQYEEFMMRYNTVNPKDTVKSIDEPCGVLTTENRFAKVKCKFLSKQYSGDPMSKNQSIDKPAGTITCVDHHAFVTAYYGNGFNTSVDDPSPTLPTRDRLALVNAQFIDNQYGKSKPSSIEQPAPTVLNHPKQSLVSTQYLLNPQYNSSGGSIDHPCFTLVARMDKIPPYLVTTEKGLGIAIFESDSPMTKKIKQFMAIYGIVDVKMRMLKISELKRIMGFPASYILIGTQAEQKKYIGNAVEVNMSRVLCEALCRKLKKAA